MENNTNNKVKGFLNSIVYSVIGLIACLAFVKYVSPLGIYIISALLIIGYLYANRRENSNYYSFLVAYIIVFAISMYCLTSDTTNSRKDAYNSGYHEGYSEGYEEATYDTENEIYGKLESEYSTYEDGYLDGLEFAVDRLPIYETFTEEELEEFDEEYTYYYYKRFPNNKPNSQEGETPIWTGIPE